LVQAGASLTLTDAAVSGPGGYGVLANDPAALTVTGTGFTGLGTAVVLNLTGVRVPALTLGGNTASGNALNGFQISGPLGSPATPTQFTLPIVGTDFPYVLPLGGRLSVPAGSSL